MNEKSPKKGGGGGGLPGSGAAAGDPRLKCHHTQHTESKPACLPIGQHRRVVPFEARVHEGPHALGVHLLLAGVGPEDRIEAEAAVPAEDDGYAVGVDGEAAESTPERSGNQRVRMTEFIREAGQAV